MLKKDEVNSPDSCLNRAEEDEPIFVLKATDPGAPAAVRRWATNYAARKCGPGQLLGFPWEFPDERSKAKYEGAMATAGAMEGWREIRAKEKQIGNR